MAAESSEVWCRELFGTEVSDVDFVWDVATEVTQVAEPTTVHLGG